MYGDKGEIPEGEYLIPIGKADIKQKGDHVTIVSFGKILKVVQEAADVLEKDGISCEIIDLRSVRPIDYECVVNSVKKTNRCVVVEESWPLASISGEIAYHLQRHAFDYLDAPVMRVMQADTPFAFSKVLIEEALPSVQKIIDSVKSYEDAEKTPGKLIKFRGNKFMKYQKKLTHLKNVISRDHLSDSLLLQHNDKPFNNEDGNFKSYALNNDIYRSFQDRSKFSQKFLKYIIRWYHWLVESSAFDASIWHLVLTIQQKTNELFEAFYHLF